ncbi:type II CAAX endopeptidase family protein [Desulfitobacterium sp.]|uniref:CPBP family intramembrane glutamic endopeptidase n=1 Tax=Desulfitobacterium sp. TaxID=49981 RepID=UPI002D0D5D4D|nr:type II CAAX endopeptidase family protein [Desulfitobacterium sp.]HVJ48080.1 type II CAAX endopeptidase family protein [Desulfitobacterium sp.]
MADKEREDQNIQRRLGWIDLVIAFAGIIGLFIILGIGTAWIASWWPHERILLYINGFLTQLMFFLLLWVLSRVRNWRWPDYGWNKIELSKFWGSVLKIYALTWILNIFYGAFLVQKGITPPNTDVYTKLLGHATPLTFILNLLLAGILAPIFEETLFRGVIFRGLQSYLGKWTSAILSAIVFSALHFQAYGFFPRFVLGLALAYLYDKHKSLYPSMAMHSLNNVVALMLVAISGGL